MPGGGDIEAMDVVSRVLKFWYDEDELDLAADGDYRMAWFKKDNAFDEAIRDQFEADVRAAANGNLGDLKGTAAGEMVMATPLVFKVKP